MMMEVHYSALKNGQRFHFTASSFTRAMNCRYNPYNIVGKIGTTGIKTDDHHWKPDNSLVNLKFLEDDMVEPVDCEKQSRNEHDDLDFIEAVLMEVGRARKLFPSNKHQLTAFNEEAGEVNKAFLDYERGDDTAENLYEECVQAAAMALRCAVEGDSEFDRYKGISSLLEERESNEKDG